MLTQIVGSLAERATLMPGLSEAGIPNVEKRLVSGPFLEHRLHVGPMGVDDLPTPVEALIDLGRVPARGGLGAPIQLRPVVDEIECEHREIAAALDLGSIISVFSILILPVNGAMYFFSASGPRCAWRSTDRNRSDPAP